MGTQTTYECDGCGNSISDPGVVAEFTITTYGLKNGSKYVDGSYHSDDLDLCASCASNVKRVINRALPQVNI